jgi:uncharacterized protein DUF5677
VQSLGLGDFDYNSRVVDEATLLSATSEEPFSRESFECLKELAQSVVLTAGVHRLDARGAPRLMTRDEAILGGLMARCAKLHFGLLDATAGRKMELLNFFVRGVVETAVNLRYLLEFGTPDVYDAFVRYSLRVDKQLHDRINANVAARGGTVLPIEDRMLQGIERAFAVAGLTLDSVDADDRSGWSKGGVWGRFKELGLKDAYVSMFGIQSHYVHGNWHDLYAYHLNAEDGGFTVDVTFGDIRPQPVLAAIVVLTDASLRYLTEAAPPSDDRAVLEDRIEFCMEKARLIERLHEAFLQRDVTNPVT